MKLSIKDYKAMTVDERRMLFVLKVLPGSDAEELDHYRRLIGSKADKENDWRELNQLTDQEWKIRERLENYETTFEMLQVLCRDASKNGWWPTEEELLAFLRQRFASHDREQEEDAKGWYQAIAMMRQIVLGKEISPADKDEGRTNWYYYENSPIITVAETLRRNCVDEPNWSPALESITLLAVFREWLYLQFVTGGDVRQTLRTLHDYWSAQSESRSYQLIEMYASLCFWTGWAEGLELKSLDDNEFVRGCRLLMKGKLPEAHKIIFKCCGDGKAGDFATCLLVHSLCMAVKPTVSRARKIMWSGDFIIKDRLDHLNKYALAIDRYVGSSWSRNWGENGRRLESDNWDPNLESDCFPVRLRAAWDYHAANEDIRMKMKKNLYEGFNFVAKSVANGYVNIGGLYLALAPEFGADAAAKPMLKEMKERGVWFFEYREPEGMDVQFMKRIGQILGVKAGIKPKSVAVKNEKSKQDGELVWELISKEPLRTKELCNLDVAPTLRSKGRDGGVFSSSLRFKDVGSEKCRGIAKPHDEKFASHIIDSSTHIGNVRSWCIRQWTMFKALIGMPNLELITVEDGVVVDSRPITVREGHCKMSMSVAENGDTVLRLPHCKKGLFRTERENELEYFDADPIVDEIAEAFATYGKDGEMVIPHECAAESGAVLEKLIEKLPVASKAKNFESKLREVKALSQCFIRLQFNDGVLSIHAFVRPVKGNDDFIFEPGLGPKEREVSSKNGDYRLVRDLEAERAAFASIKQLLEDCDVWYDGRCAWEIGAVSVAIQILERLKKAKPAIEMEWKKGKKLKASKPKVKFTAKENKSGWFDAQGTFELDDGRVRNLMDLLTALKNANGEYVELSDGEYVLLTRQMRSELESLTMAAKEKNGKLEIPRGAIPMLQSVFGGGDITLPGAMAKAAEEVRAALESEPEVPRTLEARLRPYQLEGYRWLSRLAACRFGACLADDMGLGKTLQIIAVLLARAKDGPSLVVAPASVCGNWRNEIRRFAPTLEPVIAMDDEESVAKAGPRTVVLASYGYLLFHEEEFAKKKWNGLVLDEAQAIKNESAKRTKLVKRFEAKFRIAATGTPVENKLLELWSIFDFLNTGLLGTADDFESMNRNAIKKLTKPLILRRLKGEVLDDLPTKTEVTRFVELSGAERDEYEACRLKALEDVSTADKKHKLAQMLAGLTRLRRFCCNPSLVLKSGSIGSAKLAALVELMQELHDGGHRALVFSQFTDYLKIVQKAVEESGWTSQYLDGETPLKERGKRVDAFQNGEGDFFLISLKAGGTGLNLTAADYVIILDPWWNPAVENQAADRAHRIGQKRPVTIYRLIAKDTVEEKVLDLHREKQALAADMLDGTGSSALNSEMLMGLLQ